MTLKIGSLFTGDGGLDLAVEQVTGAHPAWFVEYDEAPSKILKHHYPHVPNYGDVTKIKWDQIEPVDIITGGSPCQDLSAAGKRAGMTPGTRSNLWEHMRDAITIIKPRLVVWENVQGALSATATSTSDMEPPRDLWENPQTPIFGHSAAYSETLPKSGTTRNGQLYECQTWEHHTTGRAYSSQHGLALPTPKTTGRPIEKAQHLQTIVTLLPTPNTLDSLPAREGEARERQLHRGDMNSTRRQNMGNLREDILEAVEHLPPPNARDGDGGGAQHPDKRKAGGHQVCLTDAATIMGATDNAYGKYTPAVRRWEERTRPAPAPTQPNTKGKPQLAAPFSEWMMGLPEGWVTDPDIGLTRAQQLKAIGNGVCPQQAAEALTRLLALAPIDLTETGEVTE